MASRGINKVILIGYIGQEPEVRYMSNGNMVTNINLATTESWKDKQTSDLKEKTEWHRIVFFGKLAEISAEYLHKGYQIYIEGSLRTRKWQNQDGKDQYITEVIVGIGGVMQMLNNRRIGESDKLSVDNVEDNNNTKKSSSSIKIKDSDIDFNEEDIPF